MQLDDQIFSEGRCPCPRCQTNRARLAAHPDLPAIWPHKYDYLHAEDETGWTFDLWCRCSLCQAERERLANREVPKESISRAFKIVPLPECERWDCLACEMNAGRQTDADVLLIEGEPGRRGVVKTGLCTEHAKLMQSEDFREMYLRWAQKKYAELLNE
jgi:hypothetical protein